MSESILAHLLLLTTIADQANNHNVTVNPKTLYFPLQYMLPSSPFPDQVTHFENIYRF